MPPRSRRGRGGSTELKTPKERKPRSSVQDELPPPSTQPRRASPPPPSTASRGRSAPPSRVRVKPAASVVDRVARLRSNPRRAALSASGIMRLPIELMQEVFLCRLVVLTQPRWHEHQVIATVDPPTITSPTQTFAYRRGVLMLVCRQWSDIIAAYPPFWVYVDICPFTTAEAIQSAIHRAHSRPLQVSCVLSAAYRGGWSPRPLNLTTSQQCELVASSLASLSRSSSMFSSLLFVVQEAPVMDAFLEVLDSCRALRVDVLSDIQVVFTGHDSTSETALRSFRRTFPPLPLVSTTAGPSQAIATGSLTALTLRRCRVAWDSMQGLIPNLLELNIDSVLDPIDVPAFISLVALSPVLSHVLLGGDFLRPPTLNLGALPVPASQAMTLPSVRTLVVRRIAPDKLMSLLEHVDLPAIDKLGLDLRYKANEVGVFLHADVLSQLAIPIETNSFIRIESLHLRRADLQPPILFQAEPFFLPSFHAVAVLSLDFRDLQIQYWVWLIECAPRKLLPCLHTLSVAGLSPLDVQEYVCIRQDYSLPMLHINFLSSYLVGHDLLWFGWLRANTLSCTVVS